MKTLLMLTGLIFSLFVSAHTLNSTGAGAGEWSFADTARRSSLSQILVSYYELKDELVNSNAVAASAKATTLLQVVNGIDLKSLSETELKAFKPLQTKLSYDARHISEVRDLNHQREHFASLSLNMYSLAKSARLSDDPVYQDYCPMKKSYWLSNEPAIRNPYFGNQMLSCGSIANTIR